MAGAASTQQHGHRLSIGADVPGADQTEAGQCDGGAADEGQRGAFRSKKTITFSDSLLPFPGAYRVEVQMAPPASRAPNIDETDAMF